MNRREALLLLAGTAVIPDQLFAMGRAVHRRVQAGTLRALTPEQNETVATIAELIIPKTDTPGARDAGVPAFIDVMVAEWGDDDQRKMFTSGLANVDERSRASYGKDFVACTAQQQAEVLQDLDYELARLRDTKSDTSKNFFQAMKWLTLTGYYTSEIGATSELHYRVVPGRYEPCYPLEQP
ncbi:MAG TPA: gluconate 2-dehydrogenase subunit 3 family protein [Gemmatimonadales bacterium]|nr:gluconate 2-dehydrogenase subunit 3 family protein [Hyphomicrobiaceae bacterium]HWC75481.1 gluconate 2-dehydrogenase subunit 3 family protein [Gemmatimonadales bacterium]